MSLNINIQNLSPILPPRQDTGMQDITNRPTASPQMDAGLQNLPRDGALNFDTKLGSTHSGATNMNSVLGAGDAKGINFLDNAPINSTDPNDMTNFINNSMNNMNNSVNNTGGNDQMQQILSMIQNLIAMLANTLGMNQNDSSDTNSQGDYGNNFGSGLGDSGSHRSDRSEGPSRGKKSQRSAKPHHSENEVKSDKSSKSDNSNKTNVDPGTHADKINGPSGVKDTAMAPAEFEKHFETEGLSPYQANGSQKFDAFASDVRTENGNGIRNENKIKEEDRVDMASTNESFSATVTPDLSPGSQAMISQWHGEGEGALVKLYVDDQDGDVQTAGAENGVAGDGVFDVYTVYKDDQGEQHRINHGTITEGESLDVNFEKQGNDFTANINGTSADFSVIDDPGVYFKYGMYLQTKDPLTGEKAQPNDGGMDILERNGITKASATFDNANFSREMV